MRTKSAINRLGGALAILLAFIALVLVQSSAAPVTAVNTPTQVAQDNKPQEKPFDQAQALADLRKSIEGKETSPASEVFKNIQVLKQMRARQLLAVMEMGFGKSLGVNCTHCHTPGEWEKDDKPTKQVAREMWGMMGTINNDLLKKIPNLKSPNPTVNCTTCHRGQVKPALNLP